MVGNEYLSIQPEDFVVLAQDLMAGLGDAVQYTDGQEAQEVARRIRIHTKIKKKISVHRIERAKLLEF